MTTRDADRDVTQTSRRFRRSRRGFLAMSGATAVGALAGCLGGGGDGGSYDPSKAKMNDFSIGSFRGSGSFVESRPAPDGTSIRDLPNLAGDLGVYLGGGEGGLYLKLFEELEKVYPDLSISHSTKPSSQIANQIAEENKANKIQADVFLAVDAGSLGSVADDGATEQLSKTVVDPVPEAFRGSNRSWVGVAGRARSVPYNTNHFSASDIPSKVADFPKTDAFRGTIGWAPTYGAFQSFVTAMRLLRGKKATKQWLDDMQAMNVSRYRDEFRVSQAVADGEINVGFANHYYALRVL
ncbi:MAG: iron ABC transporter substrate-binding protein, partial [Halapricum sp.]